MFKIAPITLYGPKGTVDTFAFLDDGSSVTLLDNQIAEQLGINGPKQKLCLTWTGDINRIEADSMRVSVCVSGADGKKYRMDGVRTVQKLDLPTQSLDLSEYSDLPHLHNVVMQSYSSATPRILIGIDQSCLSFPLQSREGGQNQPSAVSTRLGWVIYGPTGVSNTNRVMVHNIVEEGDCETNDHNLHQLVKNYFAIEDAGVQTKSVVTKEEDRALLLMETTTKRIDQSDHFETGLLWSFDDFTLPNSYPMVVRRLICLESKLCKKMRNFWQR